MAGSTAAARVRPARSTPSASAACASSTSATSTTPSSCPACRPAVARTPTRWSPTPTTRPMSTSTTPARPACGPRWSWPAARTRRRPRVRSRPGTRRSGGSTSSRSRSPPPRLRAIVSQPRIFTDPATGAFNGLQNTQNGDAAPGRHGILPLPNTNTCHDITAFPELGLAAGACQGNGILLDISDPANPVRLDAVADPNFSYWHSATFSNDGSKVIFTDEWGGGTSARCRVTDQPRVGRRRDLRHRRRRDASSASYYKLPVPQTARELRGPQRVHRPRPGSRHPRPGVVPGRPVGGRLHRPANPSRSATSTGVRSTTPSAAGLNLGGLWSAYWYNGYFYGTEIARGFDAFGLTPTIDVGQRDRGRLARSSSVSSTPNCSPS